MRVTTAISVLERRIRYLETKPASPGAAHFDRAEAGALRLALSLMDSELIHRRGTFTAADADRLAHLAAIIDANPAAITADEPAELRALSEKLVDALNKRSVKAVA